MAQLDTLTVENSSAVAVTVPVIRYQYRDHLGSSVIEANEHGQVISYEEYYSYGVSAYRAAASGVDLSLKRYRFTGKERDEETGLDYFGVRYYASWLGRWTSADLGGFVDGLNLYRYVRNNPVNGIDREGYQTDEPQDPPPQEDTDGYNKNVSPEVIERVNEMKDETQKKIEFWTKMQMQAKKRYDKLQDKAKDDPGSVKIDKIVEAAKELGKMGFILGRLEKHYSVLDQSIKTEKFILDIKDEYHPKYDVGTVIYNEGVLTVWGGGVPELEHHEMVHVGQVLSGELVLLQGGLGSYSGTYDLKDEIEAYRIQFLFGNVPNKQTENEDGIIMSTEINNMKNIDVNYVESLKTIGGAKVYAGLPKVQVQINTNLRQAVEAHGGNPKKVGISQKVYEEYKMYNDLTLRMMLEVTNKSKAEDKKVYFLP